MRVLDIRRVGLFELEFADFGHALRLAEEAVGNVFADGGGFSFEIVNSLGRLRDFAEGFARALEEPGCACKGGEEGVFFEVIW